MAYIARAVQTSNRTWDPFSPFKRVSTQQLGIMSFGTPGLLTDELLDGFSITRKDVAAHWLSEKHVHHAIELSTKIENTRWFLGAQVVATRDDIRQLSHFVVIEPDALFLITTELGQIKTKLRVHDGDTRRVCLCLNNFDGTPSALYAAKRADDSFGLFLSGNELKTNSSDVDFPFIAWSQEPKGRIPMGPPKFGLMSYKCRSSGKTFVRSLDAAGIVGAEAELDTPTCLGGLDFAIHEDTVVAHIDAVVGDKLVPMIASSSDAGRTFSAFSPIDLNGFVPEAVLPAASPISRDYHGNFHVPVATMKDGEQHLFDVHSGDAVETMVLPGKGYGYNLLVFPKSPKMTDLQGRGTGLTDGIGIIATTIADGKLLISNSQAGGFHYPKERAVNHDMTQMFAFRATECCYTRAQTANMVSMDYLFIEANDDGDPLSGTLLLETWDMPLPQPVLSATAKGKEVTVRIVQDAWFENGKTTFTFSDPRVQISAVRFVDDREAVISCDREGLSGQSVSFDMKNFYYWHQGRCVID
jgi:hypothetical protein